MRFESLLLRSLFQPATPKGLQIECFKQTTCLYKPETCQKTLLCEIWDVRFREILKFIGLQMYETGILDEIENISRQS